MRFNVKDFNGHQSGDDVMTYAKVLFVMGGIAVLGMLGAEKLRAQPSPVDCDRYAQDYARNHSRNGQVLRGAGGGALLGAGIGALAGGAGTGAAIGAGVRCPHRRRPAYVPCIENIQSRVP